MVRTGQCWRQCEKTDHRTSSWSTTSWTGRVLLLNGRADRSWVAHLRRDGRASALVHDPDNVQHWVSIVGTAELVREGDEAAVEDAKVMARRYGDDPEQFTGQHRVTWRLVPTRVIERGDS